MTMTPEQFLKLPRYARIEIERLKRNLKARARDVDTLLGTHGETDVVLPYFIDGEEDMSLPSRQQVRFYTPSPRRPQDRNYVDVRLDTEGFVYISGSQAISIEPGAANTITVKLRDF